MKEISDIIFAFNIAIASGKSCALATVVHVEGSSYRRPGARMLVTDDGKLTGAISGGCLEGDALRKALLAISEGKNKLVTYDTTDDDDAKFGVQLGCNGIVHILFEPIVAAADNHPLILLKKVMEHRRPAVLTTLFSLEDKNLQPGTCVFHAAAEEMIVNGHPQPLPAQLLHNAISVLGEAQSQIIDYKAEKLSAFHQFIDSPLSLVVAGAGNDAMPLVAIASLLGWEVSIVDGRHTHATAVRFPQAKQVLILTPEALLQQLKVDGRTVFILMSHNYNYDLAMLKQLLNTDTPYIGILGPKTKMDRMYSDLGEEGINVADRTRIYSPVGLDIGAETAEEIALAIMAEVKAVLMHKDAKMLRDKAAPVHA